MSKKNKNHRWSLVLNGRTLTIKIKLMIVIVLKNFFNKNALLNSSRVQSKNLRELSIILKKIKFLIRNWPKKSQLVSSL